MATQQQFDNHAVWAVLGEVRDVIERDDAVLQQAGTHPVVDQIRYLTTAALAHQGVSDPAPYSIAAMSNLQSYTSQMMMELRNFSSSRNPGHLDNAATHVDNALNALASWPVSIVRGGAATLAHQAFREYRESAASAIAELERQLEERAGQIRTVNSELESTRADLVGKLEGLKSLTAQLEDRIAGDEGRLNAALVSNNETFLASQQRHQ
ncbi:hypothetical protein [Amycolatopsis sp. GA6-003]|uniref:hypothetical protein n=1 Tax=Amycolatopsis sp. GA6-003 TaxID=2652444 RepID=UPI003916DCD7